MLFPKLMSLNCLNFDFQECNFSEKLMTVKDNGNGLSREGCGRVGIYKATGLVNSYTLECHYQTGYRINNLPPKLNKSTMTIEPETPVTDRTSPLYMSDIASGISGKAPNYCMEIFGDVGHALCIALLEWRNCNPVSRIALSLYKSLDTVRMELIVQHSLFHYDVISDLRKRLNEDK